MLYQSAKVVGGKNRVTQTMGAMVYPGSEPWQICSFGLGCEGVQVRGDRNILADPEVFGLVEDHHLVHFQMDRRRRMKGF